MRSPRQVVRKSRPAVEVCENRTLNSLVFILNGNAFSAAKPDDLTAAAAVSLAQAGEKPVQLAYPMINTPQAFYGLARRISSISQGQPIGLVGFSAGGSLAARLSGMPNLNVTAALNFYGPPDLRDWQNAHRGDSFSVFVNSHVHFTRRFTRLLSGPSDSRSFVVNAFGTADQNVIASVSTASFLQDFSSGAVFTYLGPHGVPLSACPQAFQAFLEHL